MSNPILLLLTSTSRQLDMHACTCTTIVKIIKINKINLSNEQVQTFNFAIYLSVKEIMNHNKMNMIFQCT